MASSSAPDEVGGEDVFVHMETVRHAHLGELQPGQQLMARIAPSAQGPDRGRTARAARIAGLALAVGARSPRAVRRPRRRMLQPTMRTPQTGLAQVPLTIHSASGEHRFTVEVAATSEQQEHGPDVPPLARRPTAA